MDRDIIVQGWSRLPDTAQGRQPLRCCQCRSKATKEEPAFLRDNHITWIFGGLCHVVNLLIKKLLLLSSFVKRKRF